MRLPSGDQAGGLKASSVRWVRPEPSAFMTYISVAVALRDKGDAAAVGRPGRSPTVCCKVGQAGAVALHDVDTAARAAKGDAAAVGRPREGAVITLWVVGCIGEAGAICADSVDVAKAAFFGFEILTASHKGDLLARRSGRPAAAGGGQEEGREGES